MFIVNVTACDVINFKITFKKTPKKSGQKCKYLKNEKSFQDEIKSIIYHF